MTTISSMPDKAFRFYTRMNLTELSGYKARNLAEFAELIKKVPCASIYYHTHRFIHKHLSLSPEPPNDFAYWVSQVISEPDLGEQLACIEIIQFSTMRSLQDKIYEIVKCYIEKYPESTKKIASEGEDFYFIRAVSINFPTSYCVKTLREFVDVFRHISIDALYFHIFESRLRLEKGVDDFSYWFRTSLGEKELADEMSSLDPYTYTLEGLRAKIIYLIEKRVHT